MAAKTLQDFTLSAVAAPDDFVVGYDTAESGGERRWTVSTLANAVSGIIQQEILNKAMTTIGNYPYLEYAWVTALSADPQILTPDILNTVTLNTEVADTGNYGSISANQVTLSAGTYQYEINVNMMSFSLGGSVVGLYNVTDGQYITRSGSLSNTYGQCIKANGQMKISSTKTIRLDVIAINQGGAIWIHNTVSNSVRYTNGIAGFDQRAAIKLWKVG